MSKKTTQDDPRFKIVKDQNLKLFFLSTALVIFLLSSPLLGKGPPPECRKLSGAETIEGFRLPAGTDVCRPRGDSEWERALLPLAALSLNVPLEPRGSALLEFKIQGPLRNLLTVRGALSGNATIGGVPFRKGTEIEFYKDFFKPAYFPLRGTLSREYSLQRVTFPAGTTLQWSSGENQYENLRIAIPPQTMNFRGLKIRGNLLFHKNGEADQLTLAENHRIDGIPCRGISNEKEERGLDVSFHNNGKLKSCVLSQAHPVGSISYPKETRLDFYPEGLLRSFLFPNLPAFSSIQIGGVKCDTSVHFFHHSMVPDSYRNDFVSEENGINTQFNVLLYKNGVVAYCDIDEDQTFSGIPLTASSSGFVGVYFYESGKLRQGHLAKEKTFGKIRLPPETGIELYESGSLKTIEDHDELTIGGVRYPWNKTIYFREDGSIDSAKIK